jgi:hypothetical protein
VRSGRGPPPPAPAGGGGRRRRWGVVWSPPPPPGVRRSGPSGAVEGRGSGSVSGGLELLEQEVAANLLEGGERLLALEDGLQVPVARAQATQDVEDETHP